MNPSFDDSLVRRCFAIITTTFGVLIPFSSSAEIIDYHQNLFSPAAGERTSIGLEGIKNLRAGLKLHFGNSDVNVDKPEHLARVRRVFRTADQHQMLIAVHMHANIDHHRPYGAKDARLFLEQLLPDAPDVTIQIAHLAGGGGYDDPAIDEALAVFVEAIRRKDRRMKHVY